MHHQHGDTLAVVAVVAVVAAAAVVAVAAAAAAAAELSMHCNSRFDRVYKP